MAATLAIRAPQREMEALVGGVILKTAGAASEKMAMKRSKLTPKSVRLPRAGITMHYHEREAAPTYGGEATDKRNQPTVLFFHGITGSAGDFTSFVAKMDIPPHVRILIPEQIGHGKDIERARSDPDNFEQPTHESMLESTSEFLDEVRAGNNCNAFGISLGGAVAYYLHNKRPAVIQRTVLVSPAILACIDQALFDGIRDGTNRFFCFESRTDVKVLMRDLSTGRDDNHRKKKDPVPKFFYESIYRMSKNDVPEGYHKAMLSNLLVNAGLTRSGTLGHTPTSKIKDDVKGEEDVNPFAAETDIDYDSHRLVLWPNKDQIINYDKGQRFFKESINRNTEFETVPNCGHVFHSDGTFILDLIRSRVKEYLLNFSPLPSSS